MSKKWLNTVAKGDQAFIQMVVCPMDEYKGNKNPEVRERRVVYNALEKQISRDDIEMLLSIDEFPAGEPYRQAADQKKHLDDILEHARAKDVTGPKIKNVTAVVKPNGKGSTLFINQERKG